MRLVFLGTTGYHPNELRQTACLMMPELGVVFDAGTGMFRVREYLCTPSLDIFLSHAHLDHVVGLTFLFDVLNGHTMDRVQAHGDPVKLKAIEEHLFSEHIFPAMPQLEFRPLTQRVMLSDGAQLTHFPLEHPGGSLGYRVDWPQRSFAYVTDTTARDDADYVERIRGVDLLVHECNFADGNDQLAERTGHSWTTAVARVARKAQVGRLVLVHLDPISSTLDPVNLAAAQAVFPNTILGTDRLELEF